MRTVAAPMASPVVALGIPTSGPEEDWGIDFSKDVVILWVPGTSNHDVNPAFQEVVIRRWGNKVSLTCIDYMATIQYSVSQPTGVENLRAALKYVKKHLRPGQKFYLAGESQGAWVISDVLHEKQWYDMIDGAVLFGHPGPATSHFDYDPKVLEINHQKDIVSMPVNADDHAEFVNNVERIMHFDFTSLPYWLKYVLKNPDQLLLLGLAGLSKLPVLKNIMVDSHDYRRDMLLAILWLGVKDDGSP